MPKIIIDDKEYEVEAGQNLLQAALSQGLNLPYFCWHPAMGSVGACRQCAVTLYQDENDTRGRLNVACMTPVSEGLRASFEAPPETKFREQVIAALMTNHPHDCPVCAEGGDCHLQDMTVMTGHFKRDYPGQKRTFENQYLGPLIKHEMNRCITCYRCVRYYRDYAGGDDLAAMASKNHVYFGRHEDGVLQSPFSGNLVEVCPTGVFTDKVFGEHFSRKWDLQSAPSVCQHCSVGCNISIGERYGSLRRVINRYNSEINGHFICDRGRFGFHYVNSTKRRRNVNVGPDKIDVEWGHPKLRENLQASKNLRWVAIGSPLASLEDNHGLKTLVGPENFAGFTANSQRLANKHLQLLTECGQLSLSDIESADAILVVAEPLDTTAPRVTLAIRQALTNKAREKALSLGIPDWQEAAVREILPDNPTPLFLIGTGTTSLSKDAQEHISADVSDSISWISKIAQGINEQAPKVEQQEAEQQESDQEQLQRIVTRLKEAKNPIIVTGWHANNEELLDVCGNLAKSLPQENTKLVVMPPESNAVGLGLLCQDDSSSDLDSLLDSIDEQTGVLLLHSGANTYLNNPEALQRLAKANVLIELGHFESNVSDQAQLRLPITAFSEQSGTLVNYQGRAQAYQPALAVPDGLMSAWKWCHELAGLLDRKEQGFVSLQAVRASLVEGFPELDGLWKHSEGTKTARMSPRASGRTAQLANQTVHEPKPVQDTETNLSFSMEGLLPGKEGELPYSWRPGWNSNQSSHKFHQLNVPVYLVQRNDSDTTFAPLSGAGKSKGLEITCVKSFYTGNYLSNFAPHFTSLATPLSITISTQMAAEQGIDNDSVVAIASVEDNVAAVCKVDANLSANQVLTSQPIAGLNCNSKLVLQRASDEQILSLEKRYKDRIDGLEQDKKIMMQGLLAQDETIPIRFVGEVKS